MCPIYTNFIDALKARPKKLTEEEKTYHLKKKICLVCKRKVAGFNSFVCPKCDALYCGKCAEALSLLDNACWVCNEPIETSKPVNQIDDSVLLTANEQKSSTLLKQFKPDQISYKNPDFISFLNKELKKMDYLFIKPLEKSGVRGELYLIFHELTEENRILKVYKVPLDESSKSVLVKQDKKLSLIEHENIVKIYQSGYFVFNEQKVRYSILEYFINSKSLEELTPKVFQEKSLEIRLDLALSLIETIKNIRERGFVHGDLHEGNILISPNNELKVIDPGISKISSIPTDSDREFIQSLLRKYFFSENELKFEKFKKLTDRISFNEILIILKQIRELVISGSLKNAEQGIHTDRTKEVKRIADDRTVRNKYELVYRDLFKEYPRVQKRDCRVAISQICVSKHDNILNEFYEMKASGLLGLREDKVEMVRSKVINMIENAAENEVNILLFPEMTIDLNYGVIIKDILDLAKVYEMYIIPGSYHDQETKRNISMVIGPDGILWEQEKHIPAIIHVGGKRFKEGIEIGIKPQKTIICNTEYGRIAIIICRDFLDMDLRVELKNFEPPVDIILNPAFTPVTADFKAAHFDARRSIYAYCFFANVAEFGDSLIYTPEKERIERTIPSKEEGLIYKDIDLFKLRSERKKWEKEQKKEKLFIQSTR